MIQWKHITDGQPKHGEMIVEIDPPYNGHYCMRMRKYDQGCSWEEILEYYRQYLGLESPDFWWVSASDFPFPDKVKDDRGEDQGYYGMD